MAPARPAGTPRASAIERLLRDRIARLIRDHTGSVVAVLTVGGLRPSILGDEDATAMLVRDGAERVSRALGFAQKAPR